MVTVNKDIWQYFPMSFFTISCRICYKGKNILKCNIYELQFRFMPDLRFDDCILSRLQHQWEMTPYKCLQSSSKYSGNDSQLFCLIWLISKLGFQGSKMKSKPFWQITQLTLGIAPLSLQCFNRNAFILSILCRGVSDKVHILKKSRTNLFCISLHFNKVVIVFCFSWDDFFEDFFSNEFIWSLIVSTLKMSTLWRQNFQI